MSPHAYDRQRKSSRVNGCYAVEVETGDGRVLNAESRDLSFGGIYVVCAEPLLPGSFFEKPRYEDRSRPESQRVLLGRILLDRAGVRIARLRELSEEAGLDPAFSEKFLRFVIDEVIRHHERIAESNGS